MCQILSAKPFSPDPTHCKDGQSTVWFDIKVFYARISAAESINNTLALPDSLTVHYLPRSDPTALEVNGRRICPFSGAFLALQRSSAEGNHRGDVAYVSTDYIRTTGNLCFEVYAGEEALISGALERKKIEEFSDGVTRERLEPATWAVECICALDCSSIWTTAISSFPALEVSVAGRISGFPVVLTQTVQLIPRRIKHFRRRNNYNVLDMIPEGNENESCSFNSMDSEDPIDYKLYDCERGNPKRRKCAAEDHEISWLNGAVGIGIGIGVGMCFGVGWLVKTFQRTSSTGRRRLLQNLIHI